jgi:hypothetical protein
MNERLPIEPGGYMTGAEGQAKRSRISYKHAGDISRALETG